MQLGIDFGTTHTVAALVDRGNFPVVPFGDVDVLPTLVAAHDDGRLVFGHDAAAVAREPGWSLLRSMKRLLHGAGPRTEVALGPYRFLLRDLVAQFLTHARERLCAQLSAPSDEILQVAISVPANASSAQRMITVDAFREAGFDVVRLLNEPSAAACEYAHRFKRTVSSKREHVLVYDLGGGTFDASVLRLDDQGGEVVGSAGVSRLGGDDFDEAILALALERADLREAALGALDRDLRARLLDECRLQKEAVNPSTRKLVLDLSALAVSEDGAIDESRKARLGAVALPADDVYEACSALVEQSLSAMNEALRDAHDGAGVELDELAGIYVVGGASSFPPVYRTLREQFGATRVRRSPHPFGSCAIGLAIHLADGQTRVVAEKLTRHFGVFRETAGGSSIACDVLLAKDTPLPIAGEAPIEVKRRYRAAHNVGHFRFFECARLQAGRPEGNLALWDELRFPFDSRLRDVADLSHVAVERTESGPEVEEVIRYSAAGEVEVELRVLADGYSRTSRIAAR
jgi:molecular chaperone DnaK (HSP70)